MILAGWRLFTSLKFGIFLLSVIAAASIFGTMFYAANPALGDNAVPMARGLWFESGWFVGLLLLFALNLIFSTWHVTVMSFTIWWKREFRRGRTYYEHGSAPRAEVLVPGGPEEVEQILRKRFTRVQRDGDAFFAHKGILSRFGPTIVHVGMLTVIGAVIAKAVLLWNGGIMTEGRFLAGEGETSNVVNQPIALEQQITDRNRVETPIDVWVRVLDFDEIKHPNSNVPAYFSSLIEVLDPRTQQVTVAQLDMNHSLRINTSKYGDLQFHQAGYQKVSDDGLGRTNFDVRDRTTGERIAVTDTHPGNRVRVGETNLFLEVDGPNAGDPWRLYSTESPSEPVEEGRLTGGRKSRYAFQPSQFYTDFRIDEGTGKPVNGSKALGNAALEVKILEDDRPVETTYLFYDESLAKLVPKNHPKFHLVLDDIKVLKTVDVASIDWSQPSQAIFTIKVLDAKSGGEVGQETLGVGQRSQDFDYTVAASAGGAGEEGGSHEVRVLGPAQRFLTILSVVNEPTVPWVNLGVLITVSGALLTFLFRYRAFYGWWDKEKGTLRMALVPRWGQSTVREEFEQLVALMSHNAGPVTRVAEPNAPTEEVAPEHETVNPRLAESSS